MREGMERHQVALYLAAIAAGLLVGATTPIAASLEVAVSPAIALLLYVTFLGIPLTRIGRALRDVRFLAALGVLNFAIVPLAAFALSRVVAHDTALLVGVLLVLLTPCVDYVIVFSALAGAAHERLLAASPLLMLAQLVLLPVYLLLFAGAEAASAIDVGPFAEAFLVLIAIPLAAAALTQLLGTRLGGVRRATDAAGAAMVPLMALVLLVVVASQAARVVGDVAALGVPALLFACFLAIMAVVGRWTARVARLDVPSSRALVFSGATRNSLVVLPLALALPAEMALAPAVVVTQTLVELVGMTVYVRLIPRIVRDRDTDPLM